MGHAALSPCAQVAGSRPLLDLFRNAKNANISDVDLCGAIKEVMAGQGVALGGGVYKKKLNKNQHRSIILAKGGQYWIYEYLFAKNDRDNIDVAELNMFRLLATRYEGWEKSNWNN